MSDKAQEIIMGLRNLAETMISNPQDAKATQLAWKEVANSYGVWSYDGAREEALWAFIAMLAETGSNTAAKQAALYKIKQLKLKRAPDPARVYSGRIHPIIEAWLENPDGTREYVKFDFMQ